MSLSLQVTVGNNIAQELDQRLTYIVPVTAGLVPVTVGPVPDAGIPLEIIIPLSVIIFVLVVLIVFICFYLKYRRKSVSIGMHQQNIELVATG